MLLRTHKCFQPQYGLEDKFATLMMVGQIHRVCIRSIVCGRLFPPRARGFR
jgi:hypothetical protein